MTLSADLRERVRASYEELGSYRQVARLFRMSHNTVKSIVENLNKERKKKPGLKPKTSERDERNIKKAARKLLGNNEQVTARKVQAQCTGHALMNANDAITAMISVRYRLHLTPIVWHRPLCALFRLFDLSFDMRRYKKNNLSYGYSRVQRSHFSHGCPRSISKRYLRRVEGNSRHRSRLVCNSGEMVPRASVRENRPCKSGQHQKAPRSNHLTKDCKSKTTR